MEKPLFKRKTSCFFEPFFYSSAWFGQHALMCSSIPVSSSVASVKEPIRSKLRTAHKHKHWSKVAEKRQNPAILIPGAHELLFFLDTTFNFEGNYWKSLEKKTKTKQKKHLSDEEIHVEFLGYSLHLLKY